MNLIETMTEARRVSVPLVYITTADAPACTRKILPAMDNHERIITWNIADGLTPLEKWAQKDESAAELAEILAKEKISQSQTTDINVALRAARLVSENTVIIFQVLAPSAFFQGPRTMQQMFNLRDLFKSQFCMAIFMGPDVALPPGIANDVVMLVDPQPNFEELREIVKRQHADLKVLYPQVNDLGEEDIERSAMTVLGLSAFSAETSVSMCLNEKGVNIEALKEQRYDRLDQIKGITVWRGPEKFDDIGGCNGVKDDLRMILNSPRKKIGAIFYLDELDKMLSGIGGGDLSGMADEYLGLLLSYMQDHDVAGMLFLGPPGTSKTMVSKALGNESQRITMSVNLNLMKDHLMGNSEANLHQFFRIATAISGDKSLFIASCNSAARLPTSLLRRFKTGRYFFDLPTEEERQIIWDIKMAKYQLAPQPLPVDRQWTGAEIEACCERAWLRDISLVEAGKAIIPVAIAAPEELQQLRISANNRFLNAATGLPYAYIAESEQPQKSQVTRKMRLQ